ncbi:MAG: hypothetical protein H8E94_03790 [Alphaproteobacteria bacterium]|nr:hypothetical protein [Alphaproteobacteria bacterium]
MNTIEVGQRVKIPVLLLEAPFPDQVLAMIRWDGKDVSGVLSRSEILDMKGNKGFVAGEVLELKGDDVIMRVTKGLSAGTFSRSGKATLPLAWARENFVAVDGS